MTRSMLARLPLAILSTLAGTGRRDGRIEFESLTWQPCADPGLIKRGDFAIIHDYERRKPAPEHISSTLVLLDTRSGQLFRRLEYGGHTPEWTTNGYLYDAAQILREQVERAESKATLMQKLSMIAVQAGKQISARCAELKDRVEELVAMLGQQREVIARLENENDELSRLVNNASDDRNTAEENAQALGKALYAAIGAAHSDPALMAYLTTVLTSDQYRIACAAHPTAAEEIDREVERFEDNKAHSATSAWLKAVYVEQVKRCCDEVLMNGALPMRMAPELGMGYGTTARGPVHLSGILH